MKFLIATLLLVVSMSPWVAQGKELITIVSSYNAGHSGHVALNKILDRANTSQNKYNFVIETHPGAQGLIALNYTNSNPGNRLALIAAGVVDIFETKKALETDYKPVYALGDACWAVATNWPANESLGIKSLRAPAGSKELVIGTPGIGNVTHMIGLEAAEVAKQKTLTILFKSGNEAFLNLASNNGVNLALDSVQVVQNMKIKSPDLKIIATTCSQRHPAAANVPTLVEQGLGHIPPVINILLVSTKMPADRRDEINKLLESSTLSVGAETIFEVSNFRPPVFEKISAQQYYDKRVGQIKSLRQKYAKEIATDSK
jgi:tripartite-type tricarboxylate transporter receptor subunit TctC